MGAHCDFPGLLMRHHLKPTALRLQVLEILGLREKAWQAREILETLRTRRPVNKVTVYRILEDFVRLGLVRKVPLEGAAAHYELACEHHPPHPHFQCRVCREVQCLEPVPLEGVWLALKGPLGNRADHLEIRVAGLCHKCRDLSK